MIRVSQLGDPGWRNLVKAMFGAMRGNQLRNFFDPANGHYMLQELLFRNLDEAKLASWTQYFDRVAFYRERHPSHWLREAMGSLNHAYRLTNQVGAVKMRRIMEDIHAWSADVDFLTVNVVDRIDDFNSFSITTLEIIDAIGPSSLTELLRGIARELVSDVYPDLDPDGIAISPQGLVPFADYIRRIIRGEAVDARSSAGVVEFVDALGTDVRRALFERSEGTFKIHQVDAWVESNLLDEVHGSANHPPIDREALLSRLETLRERSGTGQVINTWVYARLNAVDLFSARRELTLGRTLGLLDIEGIYYRFIDPPAIAKPAEPAAVAPAI